MDERQPPQEDPVWNAGVRESHDDPAAELASMGIITVSDLLGTSARAVASSFVPFVVISVLVQLPAIALSVAAQEWLLHRRVAFESDPYTVVASPFDFVATFAAVSIASAFAQTVFSFLAQATLMYATVEFMAGRRATIGESLAGGFGNIGTILALSILNSLAIGLAFLACVIPGIIVTCMLFASVPAAVVERLGPIEAIQRSADLTSGHRTTIFLALLVLFLVWFTFACTVSIGLQATGANLDVGPTMPPLSARIANYALDWLLGIPLTIFQAALAGVFYARVRGVRDGVDADAIARVFE